MVQKCDETGYLQLHVCQRPENTTENGTAMVQEQEYRPCVIKRDGNVAGFFVFQVVNLILLFGSWHFLQRRKQQKLMEQHMRVQSRIRSNH
jgi:hypothetical protein